MSDFGHKGSIITGLGCFDSWGAGPFVIEAKGKSFRFEDSDRFGPSIIKKNGDPIANPWPSERSPFWRAHSLWARQGRRVAEDGITCLYDEPRRTLVRRIGRTHFIVEAGEDDGEYLVINPIKNQF